MTKPTISLQDLRRRMYDKAKAEPQHRFWGLYVHICKMDTLAQAYRMASEPRADADSVGNGGAGRGYAKHSVCTTTGRYGTTMVLQHAQLDRSHKPCSEVGTRA